MGRKLDALNLLLRSREPVRTMIFCNTKLMVDEVSAYLNKSGFTCEGIHGDMNQSQRTRVMEGFKSARIPILVATDVAARGIDVNDIDYVINYDLPQNSEIYVHRIGRTGRAGKEGTAITLCSGRRQFFGMRDIGRFTKSDIEEIPIPTVASIRKLQNENSLEQVRTALCGEIPMEFKTMVGKLMAEGHEPALIASAAMQLCFRREDAGLVDIELDRKAEDGRLYRKLLLSIGRRQKVAPNHIVSAIAGRANVHGSEIGKIEIYDERTVVGVPAERAAAIERAMQGATICGIPVRARLGSERAAARPSTGNRGERRPDRPFNRRERFDAARNASNYGNPIESAGAPQRRGKVKLSPAARARLLDPSDLSRFEVESRHNRDQAARPDKNNRRDSRNERRGNRKNADRGSKRRDRH